MSSITDHFCARLRLNYPLDSQYTCLQVSELFTAASITAFNPHFNTKELVFLINATFKTVLDSFAPCKDGRKWSNRTSLPCLNESTKELKIDHRRKEEK